MSCSKLSVTDVSHVLYLGSFTNTLPLMLSLQYVLVFYLYIFMKTFYNFHHYDILQANGLIGN